MNLSFIDEPFLIREPLAPAFENGMAAIFESQMARARCGRFGSIQTALSRCRNDNAGVRMAR
jgi:hypothetical protein